MADWLRSERSVDIRAPVQVCFDVIADFDAYPQWQPMVREIEVREHDDDGRASVVATRAVSQWRTVSYVMRYSYEPPHRVSWRQVSGDLRDLQGQYELQAGGDGATRATYRLAILPGARLAVLMRAPGFGQLATWFMGNAVDELRSRCESLVSEEPVP